MQSRISKKVYEEQSNLNYFLAKAENRLTEREFWSFLNNNQAGDPKNFRVKSMVVHGEQFAFIITSHSYQRAKLRSCWVRERVEKIAERLLNNALVCAKVREHTLFWDDDAGRTAAFDDDGILATVVVDQETSSCWVFEAGFHYVRLKTMFDVIRRKDSINYPDRFRVRPNTEVIRLNRDGSIEYDISQIEEVIPFIAHEGTVIHGY